MAYPDRKHIHVTCAIIERRGLVLATQRSAAMSPPLKWEFPGGKIRRGETAEECLHREIREELGVSISVESALQPATHEYPSVTVTLYPFVCVIADGEIELHEHADMIWLPPEKLAGLDWAAADLPVLAAYCRRGGF